MQDWLVPYAATIWALGAMGGSGSFVVAFLALVGMLVAGAAAALR